MGWKSHKGVKAQRDETTKALKIKLSSSEASNLKVWKACYQELLADTPNVSMNGVFFQIPQRMLLTERSGRLLLRKDY
jgi:hypothetical protein